MAIKIIKFDLPINGTKVTTLEALRDNLTDEIVPLARSGQLERWFKSRQMQEQAQAVANAVSRNKKDKELFLALCAVLEVEVHPDDVSAIFDAPSEAGIHIGDTIECKKDLEDIILRYNKILFDLCSIRESLIVEDFDPENKDAMECARFIIDKIDEFSEKIQELILENADFKYSSFNLALKSASSYMNLFFFTKKIGSHLNSIVLEDIQVKFKDFL